MDRDKPHRAESTKHPGRQSWLRVFVTGVTVLGLIAGIVLTARLIPVTERYFTDAQTINEPADQARTRDILWQPPRELSEVINTTTNDYEPRLSADGMTLFFVRGKAGGNAELMVSHRTPDGWTEPVPIDSVNSQYDDLGPEPSQDGQSLFFYSDRPGGYGVYDIWMAHRGEEDWQPPINLGPRVNSSYNDYSPALIPEGGVLYFASNRPQPDDAAEPDPDAWNATLREDLYQRDYDLYMARLGEAGATDVVSLATLNSSFNEGAPAVSTFGDFLYFCSDRPGGEGAFDLYRSRRLEGNHLAAENLGGTVNTGANELDPGLGLGGFALYFSSDRVDGVEAVDAPPVYNLYYTTSREVFAKSHQRERTPIDWAAIWSAAGPNLIWALLALLMLLALLALLRDVRGRRLSLLAKCLLGSVTAHILLLLLFNVWEVTATLAEQFQRGSPIRVALASPAASSALASQIRGEITTPQAPVAPEFTVERILPTSREMASATISSMAVQRHQMQVESMITTESVEHDAPLTKLLDQASSITENLAEADATQLALELPSQPAPSRVEEAESSPMNSHVNDKSTDRPPVQALTGNTQPSTRVIQPESISATQESTATAESLVSADHWQEASPESTFSTAAFERFEPATQQVSVEQFTIPTDAQERPSPVLESDMIVTLPFLAETRSPPSRSSPAQRVYATSSLGDVVRRSMDELEPVEARHPNAESTLVDALAGQQKDVEPVEMPSMEHGAAVARLSLPLLEAIAPGIPSVEPNPVVDEADVAGISTHTDRVRPTIDAAESNSALHAAPATLLPDPITEKRMDASLARTTPSNLSRAMPRVPR